MKPLVIQLERSDDEIWGLLEAPGLCYTTVGNSEAEVETSMRELVADFLVNEGSAQQEWVGVRIDDIIFETSWLNQS